MTVCKLERHCKIGPFWCSNDYESYQKCLTDNLRGSGPAGPAGPAGPSGPAGEGGDSFAGALQDMMPDSELPNGVRCWEMKNFVKGKVCATRPLDESDILDDEVERVTGLTCYYSEFSDAYFCSEQMSSLVHAMTAQPSRRCVGYSEVDGDTSQRSDSEVWFCEKCNCEDYGDRKVAE